MTSQIRWIKKWMPLNDHWLTEEIKETFKKILEIYKSEHTIIQPLWDTVKVVLRGIFIAIQPYHWKQEKSQINNINSHVKEPDKEE